MLPFVHLANGLRRPDAGFITDFNNGADRSALSNPPHYQILEISLWLTDLATYVSSLWGSDRTTESFPEPNQSCESRIDDRPTCTRKKNIPKLVGNFFWKTIIWFPKHFLKIGACMLVFLNVYSTCKTGEIVYRQWAIRNYIACRIRVLFIYSREEIHMNSE